MAQRGGTGAARILVRRDASCTWCSGRSRRTAPGRTGGQSPSLDDAQLRDTGIDRTVAGRGKAVAVDPIVAFTLRAMGDQR